MALIKNTEGKTVRTKRTVLVNAELVQKDFINLLPGKSLVEIDIMLDGKLLDIETAEKDQPDGSVIHNLVLELKDRFVAIPISKNFAEVLATDGDALLDGEFYAANKMDKEKDVEGEYPYTGPLYISFGKPSDVTFDRRKSAVKTEVEQ